MISTETKNRMLEIEKELNEIFEFVNFGELVSSDEEYKALARETELEKELADLINQIVVKLSKELDVNIVPCDYFTGINRNQGKPYFNIVLDRLISSASNSDFDKIKQIFDIEPNGMTRLAIFF